jgi:HAD superfamily hydrolase (TIGR01509 family)
MWGLLFDLDGTLALTNALHETAWREVLSEYGVSLSSARYATEISGRSNQEIVGRLLPELDHSGAQLVWERKELRFRERATGLTTLAGLRELVAWAREHSARLGVVTNAPRANAEHVLRDLGMSDVFECVVAVEDVVNPKPDPEPYAAAMTHLGLHARQCIAFEDSPSGIRSAVAAELEVIGLLTGHSDEELRAAGASAVYGDFAAPALRETLARYAA